MERSAVARLHSGHLAVLGPCVFFAKVETAKIALSIGPLSQVGTLAGMRHLAADDRKRTDLVGADVSLRSAQFVSLAVGLDDLVEQRVGIDKPIRLRIVQRRIVLE